MARRKRSSGNLQVERNQNRGPSSSSDQMESILLKADSMLLEADQLRLQLEVILQLEMFCLPTLIYRSNSEVNSEVGLIVSKGDFGIGYQRIGGIRRKSAH